MLPVDFTTEQLSLPIFNYPVLAQSRGPRGSPPFRSRARVPRHQDALRAPVSGGYTMPTIAAFMQFLPAGFSGKPYSQTDATIYVVAEGQGRTRVGSTAYDWCAREHHRRAVVGARVARGARRRRPVQSFGPSRSEGTRALARTGARQLVTCVADSDGEA